MNKTAIKNFAVWARIQLIESAKQRAYEYEITENGENKVDLETIGGRLLSKTEKEQRIQLISQIRQKGYTQVMEEAAYTWFNRFVALRFMEVNGYLPSKVRVFTDESGSFKPEMLKEAMTIELDGLDRQLILELLDKQDNETLYKHLLIAQCNALNAGLPYMFEKIANWTELLFPANLLRSDSIIGRLISDVAPEDWNDEESDHEPYGKEEGYADYGVDHLTAVGRVAACHRTQHHHHDDGEDVFEDENAHHQACEFLLAKSEVVECLVYDCC